MCLFVNFFGSFVGFTFFEKFNIGKSDSLRSVVHVSCKIDANHQIDYTGDNKCRLPTVTGN